MKDRSKCIFTNKGNIFPKTEKSYTSLHGCIVSGKNFLDRINSGEFQTDWRNITVLLTCLKHFNQSILMKKTYFLFSCFNFHSTFKMLHFTFAYYSTLPPHVQIKWHLNKILFLTPIKYCYRSPNITTHNNVL